MAIPQYIRPMAEVYQQRDIVQAATGEHLAACIVGANYDVYRYGEEDLKPHTFETPGEFVLEYEKNPLLDYALDQNSVSLYAENILATLAAEAEYNSDTQDAMIIRAAAGKCFAKTSSTASEQLVVSGYNVQIGDKVFVKDEHDEDNPIEKYAYVVGLVGKQMAPAATASAIEGNGEITVTGTYNATQNTTYIIQITSGAEGNVVITVTDTAGIDQGSTVSVPANQAYASTPLGRFGLSFSLPAASVVAGNAWSVACVAETASTTVFDGIRLSVSPVNIATWSAAVTAPSPTPYTVKMTIYHEYSGVFDSYFGSTKAWTLDQTSGADTIKIESGVRMRVGNDTYPLESGVGNLYASFRVRVIPDANEDIITIASTEDIEENFGNITLQNDLAYACACCLKGSAGRPIYAIRVRDIDQDGYMTAVQKTETNTAVYSFVALTDDLETQRAIRDYNTELSAPDVKRWRRLLVGADYPGVYTVATSDNDNMPLKATFAKATGGNYILQLDASLDFDFMNIAYNGASVAINPGDIVRISVTGDEYTVKGVMSATELLLVDGPTPIPSAPVMISLVKADSAANNEEYIINCAKALNSYRCSLVWTDKGQAIVDGTFEVIPNKFIAAEIAGISSAVVPQKSITHTEIQSVTNASRMYTQYSQRDLDNIAKNGVMIITQDTKNTPCYIRHQLTTQTDDGLMFYEESFTRNYDNISYAVAEAIEPFIGKANVVASALTSLRNKLIIVLNGFTQDTTDMLIGPSLVSYDGLQVYQDPTFMDRVIIKVNYYLPAPLNNIKCYQMAYVAQVTI